MYLIFFTSLSLLETYWAWIYWILKGIVFLSTWRLRWPSSYTKWSIGITACPSAVTVGICNMTQEQKVWGSGDLFWMISAVILGQESCNPACISLLWFLLESLVCAPVSSLYLITITVSNWALLRGINTPNQGAILIWAPFEKPGPSQPLIRTSF